MKKTFVFFRLASLPANLPKIDFEAYKKQLPNPTAIAALEKGVMQSQRLIIRKLHMIMGL